jgi:tRNA 2-selenouridine synthase
MQVLNPEYFIKESRETPVVDVRSPKEYLDGHIPGAINVPLFDDRERAVVGTLYVNRGRQTAIETGLEIIGPKMAEFARDAGKIAVKGKLLVHCWRGGMRSESMAWLYERIGIQCSVLEGGYKAYRNFLMKETGNVPFLMVIEGPTGSGKTEILLNLKSLGEQVIDLEGLACHKGSVFGGIGKESQPTTQQFQNNLLGELLRLDWSKRIWVEGESLTIGKVFLPDPFRERMINAPLAEIKVPREERIKRLVGEYGKLPKEEMEYAITSLAKRIGEVRKNEILNDYHEGNLELTARKLLDYYDKIYHHSRLNYLGKGIEIPLPGGNATENAEILLKKIAEFESF